MYGKIIRELRKEKNINQTELAKMLNTTQSNIGKYEREELDLNTSTLIRLSKIFKVSTDYILGLETEDYRKTYNQNYFGINNITNNN